MEKFFNNTIDEILQVRANLGGKKALSCTHTEANEYSATENASSAQLKYEEGACYNLILNPDPTWNVSDMQIAIASLAPVFKNYLVRVVVDLKQDATQLRTFAKFVEQLCLFRKVSKYAFEYRPSYFDGNLTPKAWLPAMTTWRRPEWESWLDLSMSVHEEKQEVSEDNISKLLDSFSDVLQCLPLSSYMLPVAIRKSHPVYDDLHKTNRPFYDKLMQTFYSHNFYTPRDIWVDEADEIQESGGWHMTEFPYRVRNLCGFGEHCSRELQSHDFTSRTSSKAQKGGANYVSIRKGIQILELFV